MHAVLEGTMLEETYRAASQLVDDVIERMQEAEGAIRKPLVGKLPRADFLSIMARLLGPRKVRRSRVCTCIRHCFALCCEFAYQFLRVSAYATGIQDNDEQDPSQRGKES